MIQTKYAFWVEEYINSGNSCSITEMIFQVKIVPRYLKSILLPQDIKCFSKAFYFFNKN